MLREDTFSTFTKRLGNVIGDDAPVCCFVVPVSFGCCSLVVNITGIVVIPVSCFIQLEGY